MYERLAFKGRQHIHADEFNGTMGLCNVHVTLSSTETLWTVKLLATKLL